MRRGIIAGVIVLSGVEDGRLLDVVVDAGESSNCLFSY